MDLVSHPDAYMAEDKEPHALCSDEVLTPAGLGTVRGQLCWGQIRSTLLRCIDRLCQAARFRTRAGARLRCCRRDSKSCTWSEVPSIEIRSQHHHEYFAGESDLLIDEAVRRHQRYIHYSRYSYQLQPWLDAVGRDRVFVIRFEDYVSSRSAVVNDLFRFVGLPPTSFAANEKAVYNKSRGKPVKNRFWNAVQRSMVYRQFLRPRLPQKARLTVRRLLLAKATELPPPAPETIAYLKATLASDTERLRAMLGVPDPMWPDFATIETGVETHGAPPLKR